MVQWGSQILSKNFLSFLFQDLLIDFVFLFYFNIPGRYCYNVAYQSITFVAPGYFENF